MRKKALRTLSTFLFNIVGCFVYSVGVTVFITPNEISPGGFTGIATIITYLLGFKSGMVLLVINIPVLILGFLKFGKEFIAKTALVTVMLSAVLSLTEYILPPLKTDKILAGIFGGILMGLGMSLILLRGATTGGVDIIAKLVNSKFRHISVGRLILFMDAAVIALAAVVYKNAESALYSVMSLYASSKMLDAMLYGADRGKIVYIVTDRAADIGKAVGERMRRGATLIRATGGYTGKEKNLLMCVLRIQEVSALYSIAEEFDPTAFIFVCDAGEIIGEGFKPHKS